MSIASPFFPAIFASWRAAAASADSNWDNRFNLPGVDGNVHALATNGNNVYVGGDFISAGGDPTIQRIARWNGTNWFALGQGVNGTVKAIAVSGTTVYVGGQFYAETNTDGSTTNVYFVAKWDGSAWSGFGNGTYPGMGGFVNSLAVVGSPLYVGGNFPTANKPDDTSLTVNNIARWDGTAWSALGGGVNYQVYVLLPSGSGVYAGGIFNQATQANSNSITANGVAYWDGANWSALGTGISGGAFPYVTALAILNNNLYVGGYFTAAGGSSANYVAKWNSASWSPLGSSVSNGVDGIVNALTVRGTNLYVGGAISLTKAADGSKVTVASEAGWDGTHWFALGRSTGSAVYALAAGAAGVYVSGNVLFGLNSDLSQVFGSGLLVWTGTNWNTIGPGLGMGDQTYAKTHAVSAIAVLGINIYAGGSFSTAGGVVSGAIARFDGNHWNAVGRGADYPVYALAPSGTNLYVGGSFSMAGGVTANSVARWDGSYWNALGTGVNGEVNALALSGGNLFAGGIFTAAGGAPATYVAKWNSASWSALGSGATNSTISYVGVNAIAIMGTNVYFGAPFNHAGGEQSYYFGRWTDASLVAPPLVAILLSGGSAIVSWPLSAGGFTLQSAGTLSAPVNWTSVPGPFSTNGGNISIALPTSGSNRFFRLIK